MSDPSPVDIPAILARAAAYEIVVAVFLAIGVTVFAFLGFGGEFQDIYLKVRGPMPVTGQVALMTIGPEELYLWDPSDPRPEETPRGMLAGVVRFLDAAGARVVVLDVILDAPAPGDDALAAAAKAQGAVIAAEQFQITEPRTGKEFVRGTSPTLSDTVIPAFANLTVAEPLLFSGQSLVREAPLVRRVSRSRLQGTWPMSAVGGEQDDEALLPSLSLAAAFLELTRASDPHASGDALRTALTTACGGTPLVCQGTLGLPALPGPLEHPLAVNFRGSEHDDGIAVAPAARALRIVAAAELTGSPIEVPEDLASTYKDKVVVVGRVDGVDQEDADRFVTPYSFPVLLRPDMAGCRIHAQVIDTLLSGRHVRVIGGTVGWLFGFGIAALVWVSRRRLSEPMHGVVWFAAGIGSVGLGAVVFRWTDGVALELGPTLLCLLISLSITHLVGWAKTQG